MTVLSDKSIIERCLDKENPMISPFVGESINRDPNGKRILSYGVSSYGYDVRLSNKFKIFTNIESVIIDPLNIDERCFMDREVDDFILMPPHSYILGHTVEYFEIPDDIIVICLSKSTYSRCGAIVNITPIEPEFKGEVVIEIANTTSSPLKIYVNQGISQFIFFKGDQKCLTSYFDRGGKYMDQRGIRLPM